MTQKTRLTHSSLTAAALVISISLLTAGCASSPREPVDASLTSKKVDSSCEEAECAPLDDGASRYQYYLGILSVLLMG